MLRKAGEASAGRTRRVTLSDLGETEHASRATRTERRVRHRRRARGVERDDTACRWKTAGRTRAADAGPRSQREDGSGTLRKVESRCGDMGVNHGRCASCRGEEVSSEPQAAPASRRSLAHCRRLVATSAG